MESSPPARTQVRVATEPERRAALELALRTLDPAARGPLLDSVGAASGHPLGVLDGLVVAVRDGTLLAAAWAQPAPGRAVLFWPPESSAPGVPDSEAYAGPITAAAAKVCDAAGVPLTQALFEVADDPRVPALVLAGFQPIATLDYLARRIPSDPGELETPRSSITFEPCADADLERLKSVLAATYVGSLDCPGLDDLRDLDDSIASYRMTGHFDPEHWFFVRTDDVDIGALLMAEHPNADQAELIYMGVAADARGYGYGIDLVRKALLVAQEMGVDQLVVAVDCDNTPARRAYDQTGFAAWARRYVYVRSLHAS